MTPLPKLTYYLASNGRLMQTDGDVDCTGKKVTICTADQLRQYGEAEYKRGQSELTAERDAAREALKTTFLLEAELRKERDALKAQRDHLYKEMHYISGITHGQPLRVAAAAMTAVAEMKGTS